MGREARACSEKAIISAQVFRMPKWKRFALLEDTGDAGAVTFIVGDHTREQFSLGFDGALFDAARIE